MYPVTARSASSNTQPVSSKGSLYFTRHFETLSVLLSALRGKCSLLSEEKQSSGTQNDWRLIPVAELETVSRPSGACTPAHQGYPGSQSLSCWAIGMNLRVCVCENWGVV